MRGIWAQAMYQACGVRKPRMQPVAKCADAGTPAQLTDDFELTVGPRSDVQKISHPENWARSFARCVLSPMICLK